MKVKKLLALFLSLGLFLSFAEPVNAKNNSTNSKKVETTSNEICTENPEYESRKKAFEDAKVEVELAQNKKIIADDEKSNAQDAYNSANANVNEKNTAYEEANANADLSSSEYLARKDALEKANANLTGAMDVLTSETETAAKLNKELKNLQADRDLKNEEIKSAKAELSSKEDELNKAKDALTKVQEDLKKSDANKEAKANALNEAKNLVSEKQQAVNDAQSAVDSAVAEREQLYKELEAKKTALDNANKLAEEASERIAHGSVGYFENKGNSTAVDIINKASELSNFRAYYPDSQPLEEGLTKKEDQGKEGDATSLENMKLALETLKNCNDRRIAAGLEPIKISDEAMASSQVNANMEAYVWNHVGGTGSYGAENLANGLLDRNEKCSYR